jgi:membrane protein DedA with SNARE-associated domain
MELAKLLMIALGTALQEDLGCIAAGLTAARGEIALLPALAACAVAIYGIDLSFFLAGKICGGWLLRRPPLRWLISEPQLNIATRFVDRRGPAVVFFSRFMPGLRAAIQFSAGMLGVGLTTAAAFFVASAVVYASLLFLLVFALDEALLEHWPAYQRWGIAGMLIVAALVWLVVRFVAQRLPRVTRDAERPLSNSSD